MPFDQLTYNEPKETLLSLASLKEWLRLQDLDTEYDYCSNGDCLLARFLRCKGMDLGRTYGVGGHSWHEKTGSSYPIPQNIIDILQVMPRTYRTVLNAAEAHTG